MNKSRIKRENIKKYIRHCKCELKKIEKNIVEMQNENENEKFGLLIYDLTDTYLTEENYRGQILAATYILNNC